jgi:hypothetical protein
VNERDPGSSASEPGHVIDQSGAGLAQMCERLVEIEHRVRHMMQSFSSLLEKSPDRGFGSEWEEQLDERATQRKQGFLHPLAFDHLAVAGLDPVTAAISLQSGFEVTHCDTDVVQVVGEHVLILA